MERLPSDKEIDWLLDQLAALIRRQGFETYLSAPFITPGSTCFPDRWSQDERGVRVLARRLLGYAGLPHLDVCVTMFVNVDSELPFAGLGEGGVRTHQGIAAWYADTRDGTCHFGANARGLEDADAIVGILSHEVAHAWRSHHNLVEEDRQTEELLTDLTTVYLGFGILTTNASYRYRSTGKEWSHRRSGYLSPQCMSFLLATQAVLCELAPKEVAEWLGTNQGSFFRAAWNSLDSEELIEHLALPPKSSWPPARDLVVQPIAED